MLPFTASAAGESVFHFLSFPFLCYYCYSLSHSNFSPLLSSQQAALVLNASRRFRYTLDLKKEEEKEQIRTKIRAHAQVIRVCIPSYPLLSFPSLPQFFTFFSFHLRLHFSSRRPAKKRLSVLLSLNSLHHNPNLLYFFPLQILNNALQINP